MAAVTLFRPAVQYRTAGRSLSGLGWDPIGDFNKAAGTVTQMFTPFVTGAASTLTDLAKVSVKWSDPDTYVKLNTTANDSVDTLTGAKAQRLAQQAAVELQQTRAQADVASSAAWAGTLQSLIPWAIGGAVVITGLVILGKRK